MNTILNRYAISIILLIILVTMPIIGIGCQEEEVQPPAPIPGIAISSTIVPNIDFDVYVYVKQENPTTVPKDVIGIPSDMYVESLALWGMPTEEAFVFGGAVTLASEADAANIYGQVPNQYDIWTSLSKRTIYFVHGSGVTSDTLKSAISNNNFKYYDDQEALLELSLFPSGEATKLAAVAIAKPSKTLVNLIAKKAAPEASNLLGVLLSTANLQVVTAGLYAPQQIDVAKMVRATGLSGILESDLGILALVKSGWPGTVVSPIARKALESAGYVKTSLGELTVYKGSLDSGNDKMMPIILRVEGNRIFAAMSGKESYAETLITSLEIYYGKN